MRSVFLAMGSAVAKLVTTAWILSIIASASLGVAAALIIIKHSPTPLTATVTETVTLTLTTTVTPKASPSASPPPLTPKALTQVKVVKGLILLPLPHDVGNVSAAKAILLRRSIREYLRKPLSIDDVSMLLWAAQGITDVKHLFRAAPSAGATYPLVLYLVVGYEGVSLGGGEYLKPGVYRYIVNLHALKPVKYGDLRGELSKASLNQPWVRNAPIDIVMCAVFSRTTKVYGERGIRYVYMEAGHAAENIYLMASALGLGTVVVGAFHDELVASVIGAGSNESPLYVIPVGIPEHARHVSFKVIDDWYVNERVRVLGSG